MIRFLPLLLALVAGCSQPVADYRGQFVGLIAISAAIAETSSPAAPEPSGVCPTCDGKGRLPIRDTGRFEDCPDCDLDPPLTPLSTDAAEPQDAEQDAPAAVEWLTLEEAQASGEPYFVVQHYADPEMDAACRPCRKLETLLDLPEVAAFFTERGALVSDTCERWQQAAADDVEAPAIAFVDPDAAPGDNVPWVYGYHNQRNPKGFKLASPEAFLETVKAWFDAIPQ